MSAPVNFRESNAREKAQLALRLNRLVKTCPPKVCNGSVQTVAAWTEVQKKARKVLSDKQASVPELYSAIHQMEVWL